MITVAEALTLIQILGGVGTLAKTILDIRADLEKLPPDAPTPAAHVAALKSALGSGGSVFDETAEGFIQGTLGR